MHISANVLYWGNQKQTQIAGPGGNWADIFKPYTAEAGMETAQIRCMQYPRSAIQHIGRHGAPPSHVYILNPYNT